MTDQTHDNAINEPSPDLTPDELAYLSEPEPTPSRTKKWLAGAALVTAGVVAGSGATYAITAQASTGQGQGQFSNAQGGPGGGFGGMNQRPGSADGQNGQNGQQPGTQAGQGAPSSQTSTG
jgi:hypothetical protein